MKKLLYLALLLAAQAHAAIGTPEVGTVDYETDTDAVCALSGVTTTSGNLLLCVAHAAVDGAEPSATPPTGWTTVYQYDQIVIYGKISDGTEADPTITFGSSSGVKGVYAISVSGTEQTIGSILDGTPGEAGSFETADLTYPSYTPGNSGTMCLIIGHKANLSWTQIDPATSFTELLDDVTTLGGDISLTVDYWLNCSAVTGSTKDITSGDGSGVTDVLTLGINAPTASVPTFTSAPAADTLDASGYNVDATADIDSTFYCIAQHPAVATPTAVQIEAGNNGAGAAALESGNVALTGGVEGTIHFTGLGSWPVTEVHCHVSTAGGDSSVSSISDQLRGPRSGFQIVELTSVSTTSPCDLDTYFDPDVAIGDYIEVETATNESAFSITFGADCDFSYDSGGDVSRQSFEYCPYDYSAGAAFTAPASCDDTIWINNEAPTSSQFVPLVLDINEAMTTLDVCALFTDKEGDTLTQTNVSGTLPTGLSMGGTGDCELSGTPTVEDESGVTITYTVTDVVDSDTLAIDMYVIDTVTMPTLTGGDLDAAITAELAAFPWRDQPELTASFECNTAEAVDQVLTQSPAATTEVEADQAISVVVSTGSTCANRRR